MQANKGRGKPILWISQPQHLERRNAVAAEHIVCRERTKNHEASPLADMIPNGKRRDRKLDRKWRDIRGFFRFQVRRPGAFELRETGGAG